MKRTVLVALAGQPNCGKSTVFNMLTGARQHVANYPGVTVEKKTGQLRLGDADCELVDLPGIYSLSSYSPEERVARDFIIHDRPQAIINIVDAVSLKRSLYLTLQLLEMEVPLVVNLNMMDVAERRGMAIDAEILSRRLGVPVVRGVGKKGIGRKELCRAVAETVFGEAQTVSLRVEYGPIEEHLDAVKGLLDAGQALPFPHRWLAVKLMEGDSAVEALIRDNSLEPAAILSEAARRREDFAQAMGQSAERYMSLRRHAVAQELADAALKVTERPGRSLTARIDDLVCHRIAGPIILVGVLYALYYLSIVEGYKLTNYTWPYLAKFKQIVSGLLPQAGFLEEPLLRSLGLWLVDSVNALLNYIPIFLILFALVAMLEDSGYMPRMAFILDRLLRHFGLHGQSTLPLILSGVYVGGCCVPGVMACKAIPDDKARLTTILIVPLMNCLAKVPLYILLVNAFFPQNKAGAMFFISTVTILMALPIAKALNLTVLRKQERAPFIMEMPPYHLPTLRGVLLRAVERVWLFMRKIVTVVTAVAVIVFTLLQFPGLSAERTAEYKGQAESLVTEFNAVVPADHAILRPLDMDGLKELFLFEERYKAARSSVSSQEQAKAVDERFQAENEAFFLLLKPKGDKGARALSAAMRDVGRKRQELLLEMKKERLDGSFLGILGHFLEPVTQFAGFSWRINAGLLSAFAAKESAVATLGAIYGLTGGEGSTTSLEQGMLQTETGFTGLHALALMLFMALYPPCVATTMMVRVQTGDSKWMLFAMLYPMFLGIIVASAVFSGSRLLGLDGWTAMWVFYGLCLFATLVAAALPDRDPEPKAVLTTPATNT